MAAIHALVIVQIYFVQNRQIIAQEVTKKMRMDVKHASVKNQQTELIINVNHWNVVLSVNMGYNVMKMVVRCVHVIVVHYEHVACSVCTVFDETKKDAKSVNAIGHPYLRRFNAVKEFHVLALEYAI